MSIGRLPITNVAVPSGRVVPWQVMMPAVHRATALHCYVLLINFPRRSKHALSTTACNSLESIFTATCDSYTSSSLHTSGQTGSGKTYTMLGDSSDLTSAAGEGTAGLIPRICVELFQRFGLTSRGSGGAAENSYRGNGPASVQVSFCEVI